MSLLLATDPVELYPAGDQDELGWTEPGTQPSWCGAGNLQLGPGVSDPQATVGGGTGPHAPGGAQSGVLFLPLNACPREGWSAVIRGERWVLSQVRLVTDPTGGQLDCWLATVSGGLG